MANGDKYQIPRNGAMKPYIEYKMQPADFNKGLKQIAREKLGNENLYVDILLKTAEPTTNPWYTEIVHKDRIDPNSTLLLPIVANPGPIPPPQPAPTAKFKLLNKQYIRTSPRIEANNMHGNIPSPIGVEYTYKTNNIHRENGLVWVDITPSNIPNKANGATYWMCVRENAITHTNPPIS